MPSIVSSSASLIAALPIVKPVAVTTPLDVIAAAANGASVTLMLPVALATAVVVPTWNPSALSSHIKIALLPVEPRSMIIPISFAFEPAPVLSSISVSSTTVFVDESVVVVPLTTKLPVTVSTPPTVTSSGSAILILLSLTVVAISFAVPSNVSVSVPTVTVSFDPVSAAIVKLEPELT